MQALNPFSRPMLPRPKARCLAILITAAGLGTHGSCSRGDKEAPPSGDTSHALDRPPVSLLTDVTSESGIDFVHDPVAKGDYLFPEINGSGCAFLDHDNDGLLDVYLVQSGRDLENPDAPAKPNRLYRNQGDGTFEDVTEASGAGDTGYGQGLAVGDYDNDGYVDIYVANVGGPCALLHNRGNGTFENVTETAGVANGQWAITPAFVDYDHDGLLDLFATNYVEWSVETDRECRSSSGERDYCGPMVYRPARSILYRNLGNGTFEDVSEATGIHSAFGAGMGIICADFNDDTLTDIYVANDTFANQLWMNRGDGTFEDRALVTGCAVDASGTALSSMGTNVEDLDRDGDLDLFTTNYVTQGSVVYLQSETGFFVELAARTQLHRMTVARTGFGACFLDLFNDGNLCVYVGNGGAGRMIQDDAEASQYAQPDQVLRWVVDDLRFEDISDQVGPAMDVKRVTRGVAMGDYDNDGAVDILLNNNGGPARLLRNTAAGNKNWIMVRCIGKDDARDAIGAAVLVTIGDQTRRRDVIVNHSYASANDPRIHFGLGEHERVDAITVRWPGGGESTWKDVAANQVFVARYRENPP